MAWELELGSSPDVWVPAGAANTNLADVNAMGAHRTILDEAKTPLSPVQSRVSKAMISTSMGLITSWWRTTPKSSLRENGDEVPAAR